MKTRCTLCGCGYLGRHIGETCNDRSGPVRRALKKCRDADVVRPCQGVLVRPEDYRIYHREK